MVNRKILDIIEYFVVLIAFLRESGNFQPTAVLGGMVSGNYNRKDHLYHRAKEEGYRSRAAYKLIELDKKFSLLSRGSSVVDLGCFPGGWLQVAAKQVGPKGRVVGIDLRDVDPLTVAEIGPGVAPILLKGDLTDLLVREELKRAIGGRASLVLSDMSPQLTGIRFRDVVRSAELVEIAFEVAKDVLQDGGTFVAKLFPGSESDELLRLLRPYFMKLTRHCLKSTRTSSNEFYVVGRGLKRNDI